MTEDSKKSLATDLFQIGSGVGEAELLEIYRDLLENILWENSNTINELKKSERQLKREAEERDRLEAELRMAQKMEAVGQLAAGIAHEINTPTQFISDNIHFITDCMDDLKKVIQQAMTLAETIEKGEANADHAQAFKELYEEADMEYFFEEAPVALEQCHEGIDRVRTIVQSMKEFSHPGADPDAVSGVDLNSTIRNTVTVATNEWKYVAEVELNLEENLPIIQAISSEIKQVILNLIVNAAHAIADSQKSEKGKITISTAFDEGFVEVRITDTGTGIPEKVRDKLFEPFFTTKEVGKGTGQGLYISHKVIVQNHGGSLKFETTLDVGTTFIIRLPVSITDANQNKTAE